MFYTSMSKKSYDNCPLYTGCTPFDELDHQYGASEYGQIKYSAETLYWIGYIYRYWAYTHEKSSKQVYRLAKPQELAQLYFPYHSLDPAQAIERILEAKGVTYEDDIARGVRIMRMVRERAKYRTSGGKDEL